MGLAYSPGFTQGVLGEIFGGPGKSSIRASYGMFYTTLEGLTQFYEVGDAPGNLYFVANQVYFDLPFKSRNSSHDPGQRFPFTNDPKTINFAQFLPIGGSPGFDYRARLPYSHHYDFSIQRQIASSSLLTIAFVGTEGHHLIVQREANPGNAALCLATPGCGPFGEDNIYTLSNGQSVYGTRLHSVTSGLFLNQGRLDFSSNNFTSTIANSTGQPAAIDRTCPRKRSLRKVWLLANGIGRSPVESDFAIFENPSCLRSLRPHRFSATRSVPVFFLSPETDILLNRTSRLDSLVGNTAKPRPAACPTCHLKRSRVCANSVFS